MLAWPDGARRLVGYDGISVTVEPTLFDVEPVRLAPIDAAIPAEVRVTMPARSQEEIPVPRESSVASTQKQAGGGLGSTAKIVLTLVGLALVVAVITAIVESSMSGSQVIGAITRVACIALVVGGFGAWTARKEKKE